jgi:hypothetical protein
MSNGDDFVWFLLHHSSASHDLNRSSNVNCRGEVSGMRHETESGPAQDKVHLWNDIPSSVNSFSDFCAG